MIRIEFQRGTEIQQRLAAVALLAPELAAAVEEIGLRWIELKRSVVIGDSAIGLVFAGESAGACNQCLEAIGPGGLLMVDQRTACADDLVVVNGGDSRETRCGNDRRRRRCPGAGRAHQMRRGTQQEREHAAKTENLQAALAAYPSNIRLPRHSRAAALWSICRRFCW
jgi:hypothetical protein